MSLGRLIIFLALVTAIGLVGSAYLQLLTTDPVGTLRWTIDGATRFAWLWLAVLAWVARGLWERARRARYYDHTSTGRQYPR